MGCPMNILPPVTYLSDTGCLDIKGATHIVV